MARLTSRGEIGFSRCRSRSAGVWMREQQTRCDELLEHGHHDGVVQHCIGTLQIGDSRQQVACQGTTVARCKRQRGLEFDRLVHWLAK